MCRPRIESSSLNCAQLLAASAPANAQTGYKTAQQWHNGWVNFVALPLNVAQRYWWAHSVEQSAVCRARLYSRTAWTRSGGGGWRHLFGRILSLKSHWTGAVTRDAVSAVSSVMVVMRLTMYCVSSVAVLLGCSRGGSKGRPEGRPQ